MAVQNLYHVDPTGKDYTLPVDPLIRAYERQTMGKIAQSQALGQTIAAGVDAMETYQARKQLANLSAQTQDLTPGSPDFDRKVAQLIYSNQLAFNNPATAQAARAGLSYLAQSHGQALKRQDTLEERAYQQRRDQALFENQRQLIEDRYNVRKPEAFDFEAFKNSLNGDTSSATPQGAPIEPAMSSGGDTSSATPQGAPIEPAMSSGGDTGTGNLPSGDGTVSTDLLPGMEGPTGAKGPPGPAITVPKTPSVKASVNDQEADLNRKLNLIKIQADALDRAQNPQAAAQVRSLGADYQKQLDVLRGSPEYQGALIERQATLENRISSVKAQQLKPDVISALSSQFPTLPIEWQVEMEKDIGNARSATELQVRRDAWFADMSRAVQMQESGLSIPSDPSKFQVKDVAVKQAAYQKALDEFRRSGLATKVPLLKAYADAEEMKGNTAADKSFNIKRAAAQEELKVLEPQFKEAQDKVTAAQERYQNALRGAGLLKESPKPETQTAPAQESLSPFEKRMKKASAANEYTLTEKWRSDYAMDRLAVEYPEVIDRLEKVAVEKPEMERIAIQEALSGFMESTASVFNPEGGMEYKENAKDVFKDVDPYKVAKQIVDKFRARQNAIPESGSSSTNSWTIKKIR